MTSVEPASDLPASTSGFVYAADRRAARRQLQCSLGVVIVLGIAIAAAALSLPPRRSSDPGYAAFLSSGALHAERLVRPAARS